ncbi:PIN domain-containing protein [Candidatus Fermentibacteria bacterium]|nr:PIN domain-containing protein [Candidatus Fermentibacteria bacterium]
MRRVVYDLNVILDVLLKREPFFSASARALDAAGRGAVEGFIAGHSVATLHYVLRRCVGDRKARLLMSELFQRLIVAPVSDAGVRRALESPVEDFEDSLVSAAAAEVNAAVIVTRNTSDFRRSSIPALLPEVFTAT